MNKKSIRENCVAEPGSMAQLVAKNTICWMCEDTVWLPGRKCASCMCFFCDKCLVNVVLRDCPQCSFGMLHKIDRVDQSLILALLFRCQRKTCSKSKNKSTFTYLQYLYHHLEHLAQDCAPYWKSEDQPQNVQVYDGLPLRSIIAHLKKGVDYKMRLPAEEQKVPNSEIQIIEQKVQLNLDQKDVKLRQINNPWTPEEDQALLLLITETKGIPWKKLADILCAQGFKNRTPNTLKQRWREYLNVDKSEIRDEEKQLILELCRQGLSYAQIAKRLERRSAIWVKNEYVKHLRNHLSIIKEHLKLELTNDQICNEVKANNIAIEKLQHLKEEERKIIESSLKFVHDDRHGQKLIKQLLASQCRSNKRNPVKHAELARKQYHAKKQRLLLDNPPNIIPHAQRSQSHHSSQSSPPNSPIVQNSPKSDVKIGKRRYSQK